MLYHQSVHTNLKTMRERKHISNLIQFFHFSIFFNIFTFRSSHTISILLYSTHFFVKTFFFFKHGIFSFNNSYLFYTCQFQHSKIIIIFSIFRLLFKIKHHPISRKKQDEKLFFVFFSKIQNTFFVLTRVKFFES